jgi:hypothetical protein
MSKKSFKDAYKERMKQSNASKDSGGVSGKNFINVIIWMKKISGINLRREPISLTFSLSSL